MRARDLLPDTLADPVATRTLRAVTSPPITPRFEQLLTALPRFGFEIAHREFDQAVLRRLEDDTSVILTASDTWISAMQLLFDAGELRASNHTPSAYRFAMQLHGRYMGCRFGFDEDENLCVQYDIYPDMDMQHIALALTQMAYVAAACQPLFELVLAGGTVDDRLIERAFAADGEMTDDDGRATDN